TPEEKVESREPKRVPPVEGETDEELYFVWRPPSGTAPEESTVPVAVEEAAVPEPEEPLREEIIPEPVVEVPVPGPASGDLEIFDVEKLLKQKRVRGQERILVKWQGWKDPTWE